MKKLLIITVCLGLGQQAFTTDAPPALIDDIYIKTITSYEREPLSYCIELKKFWDEEFGLAVLGTEAVLALFATIPGALACHFVPETCSVIAGITGSIFGSVFITIAVSSSLSLGMHYKQVSEQNKVRKNNHELVSLFQAAHDYQNKEHINYAKDTFASLVKKYQSFDHEKISITDCAKEICSYIDKGYFILTEELCSNAQGQNTGKWRNIKAKNLIKKMIKKRQINPESYLLLNIN